ncbi:Estradiol 17-beta-dehydrogenase 2, partial [Stegodyphus mimosarum]
MAAKSCLVCVAHWVLFALCLKILGLILPTSITWYYTCPANALLYCLLAGWTYHFTKKRYLGDRIQPQNKAVLITGCDSGFGNLLAKRLDSRGFHVFASCLFPNGPGAEDLKKSCSKRLQVLELDVTNDESVQNAVNFVKENIGSSDLWAIVNNAGVQKGFSIELTGIDEFKDTMEVNAIGPVRVTKAFLPLLRQAKGRVINLTSLAGRVTMPHFSPYTTSKFAAVAFTECLKQEMDVWGVKVISVEPEMFMTPIIHATIKNIDHTFDSLEKGIRADYGEKFLKGFKVFLECLTSMASTKINIVIDDLESAIALEYPNAIYKPRRNFAARIACYIFERFPRSVTDWLIRIIFALMGLPIPKEAENTI